MLWICSFAMSNHLAKLQLSLFPETGWVALLTAIGLLQNWPTCHCTLLFPKPSLFRSVGLQLPCWLELWYLHTAGGYWLGGKDVFAWDLPNLKSISHFQEMDLALITELKMWKSNIFFEGCISEAGLGGTISLQRKTLSIQLDRWMDFRSPVNSDEAFLSLFH